MLPSSFVSYNFLVTIVFASQGHFGTQLTCMQNGIVCHPLYHFKFLRATGMIDDVKSRSYKNRDVVEPSPM